MGISAIAFTEKGMKLGRLLQSRIGDGFALSRCDESELFSWTKANFTTGNPLVFISDVETAVHAIAPFLQGRDQDPAVVVIDEPGNFAIPLLSGRQNTANGLASAIAKFAAGTAVLTSAADAKNMFAIDAWASSVGLRIANPECAKHISAKLLAGETVKYGSIFPIIGAAPAGIEESSSEDNCDFVITYLSSVPEKTLHLVPPVLTLGVSCSSGVSAAELDAAFSKFMQNCGCHHLAIRELCTIDQNTEAPGLPEFCARHGMPLRRFFSQDLPKPCNTLAETCFAGQEAEICKDCEQSAVLGSAGGALFVRKTVFDGIGMALAIKEPGVPEKDLPL